MLKEFITDAWAGGWLRKISPMLPRSVQNKISFRHIPGIPDEKVSCLWSTTVLEHSRHRFGLSPALTWMKLDGRFSEAAYRVAVRHRCDLFLYSPYAWEAFTASYHHQP